MSRFSVSARTTNAPTTTLPGASLYAIANVNLRVKEIGVFNTTATACAISINRLDSAGTQGSGLTEGYIADPGSGVTIYGTGFQSHTSTPPTLGEELVRVSLGAAVGAGMVWTFDDEPILIPAGTANGIGIMAATGTGQILDFYIIWEE